MTSPGIHRLDPLGKGNTLVDTPIKLSRAKLTAVQKLLIAGGYDLRRYGADGKPGSETTDAIVKFQRDYNRMQERLGSPPIAVTGTADADTTAAIRSTLTADRALRGVQRQLVDLGLLKGKATGRMDIGTVDALTRLQTEYADWYARGRGGRWDSAPVPPPVTGRADAATRALLEGGFGEAALMLGALDQIGPQEGGAAARSTATTQAALSPPSVRFPAARGKAGALGGSDERAARDALQQWEKSMHGWYHTTLLPTLSEMTGHDDVSARLGQMTLADPVANLWDDPARMGKGQEREAEILLARFHQGIARPDARKMSATGLQAEISHHLGMMGQAGDPWLKSPLPTPQDGSPSAYGNGFRARRLLILAGEIERRTPSTLRSSEQRQLAETGARAAAASAYNLHFTDRPNAGATKESARVARTLADRRDGYLAEEFGITVGGRKELLSPEAHHKGELQEALAALQ
jgi:hypothetical protein